MLYEIIQNFSNLVLYKLHFEAVLTFMESNEFLNRKFPKIVLTIGIFPFFSIVGSKKHDIGILGFVAQ